MALGGRTVGGAVAGCGFREVGHDESLPRSRRMCSPRLFQEAFKQSAGYAGRTVVVWPRRGPNAAARLGVIASKRTFPKAVQRARAKRLVREAFRRCRYLLATEADLVVVARRRILETPVDEVRHDLERLTGRLKLMRADGGGACA
jgi:ribonuclease P protein component